MKSNVGVLLVSRNNASMIQEWADNNPREGLCILNLDESTEAESKKLCFQACSHLGINYSRALPGGMVANLRQAADFFSEREIEWVLYMHHDAYPEGSHTISQLSKTLGSYDLSEFGVIGFNIVDGHEAILNWEAGADRLHTLARAPLELGDGWYRPIPSSAFNYERVGLVPFAVESVHWSTALISCKVIRDELVLDPNFVFFHAWDDIAFQLMMRGRYNIVIPRLTFMHDQVVKVSHGLPVNSPIGSEPGKTVHFYYGRDDHLTSWFEKWKFRWDFRKFGQVTYVPEALQEPVRRFFKKISAEFQFDPLKRLETVARNDFRRVRQDYEGTIPLEFFNHDPGSGPLMYFPDIKVS